MDQDQDFSKLRNLLALKKLDLPADTQVDQFLIEFHRRQRAQLLQPISVWTRAKTWVEERLAAFELVPTLSYGTALAAIALTAFFGFSQQVQVTEKAGHPFQLSFKMAPHDGTLAMLPSTLTATPSTPRIADNLHFSTSPSASSTTRFVLANNTPRAYDSTVAF